MDERVLRVSEDSKGEQTMTELWLRTAKSPAREVDLALQPPTAVAASGSAVRRGQRNASAGFDAARELFARQLLDATVGVNVNARLVPDDL